jgi:Carbamoyltransferase C-terminus
MATTGTGDAAEPSSTLRAAREDHDSVVNLTRELVRIPSRAGTDAVLLNTSLNLHGEPIARTASDALRCSETPGCGICSSALTSHARRTLNRLRF